MKKRDMLWGLLAIMAMAVYMLACGSRPAWSPDSKQVVFGFHLIPHGPMVRTISGQLFAVAVAYFLCRAIRRESRATDKPRPFRLLGYVSIIIAMVLALLGLGFFVSLAGVLLTRLPKKNLRTILAAKCKLT